MIFYLICAAIALAVIVGSIPSLGMDEDEFIF